MAQSTQELSVMTSSGSNSESVVVPLPVPRSEDPRDETPIHRVDPLNTLTGYVVSDTQTMVVSAGISVIYWAIFFVSSLFTFNTMYDHVLVVYSEIEDFLTTLLFVVWLSIFSMSLTITMISLIMALTSSIFIAFRMIIKINTRV